MAHILYVEPDVVLARVYEEALQASGYSVCAVLSAQAAVSAADDMLPDIVILELQLPRHNGLEFLYEFRSYPDWHQVPVLIHSMVPAGEFMLVQDYSRQFLGICGYLYKPQTSLAELVCKVRDLLRTPVP